MYEFIFLGLIPGTHIQLTFSAWVLVAGSVLVIVATYRIIRSLHIRMSLLALYLLAARRRLV